MIKIYYNNVWSKIEAPSKYFRVCQTALTKPYSSFAKWGGKVRHSVKYECFLKSDNHFLSGLIHILCAQLKKKYIKYEIIDVRPEPNFIAPVQITNDNLTNLVLRPDQLKAVNNALKYERGIWHYATRSGKSYVAAGLIQALDTVSLFIVNNKELLAQTEELFNKLLDAPVGVIQGNRVEIDKVTIGMQQSVYRKLDELKDYLNFVNLIIIDEAHKQKSDTYQQVSIKCPARYRILMSGTIPSEKTIDGWKIRAHGGRVVSEIRTKELSDAGLIAKPEFFFIKCNKSTVDISDYNSSKFQEFQIKATVKNLHRNVLISDLVEKNKGKKIVIIVKYIEHGYILKQLVPDSVYIHGDTEDNYDTIKKFNNNEFDVLIGSSIIDEGITLPKVDMVVLAAGGKSDRQLAQRIGRGLNPTNETVKIYDFLDDFHPQFKKHSMERIKYIRGQGFEVNII